METHVNLSSLAHHVSNSCTWWNADQVHSCLLVAFGAPSHDRLALALALPQRGPPCPPSPPSPLRPPSPPRRTPLPPFAPTTSTSTSPRRLRTVAAYQTPAERKDKQHDFHAYLNDTYTLVRMGEQWAGVSAGLVTNVLFRAGPLRPAEGSSDTESDPTRRKDRLRSFVTGVCTRPDVQDLSVVAVDNESGRVVGAILNEALGPATARPAYGTSSGGDFYAATQSLIGGLKSDFFEDDACTLDRTETLHVTMLAVETVCQRQGIGRALWKAAETRARDAGFKGMVTVCTSGAVGAIASEAGFTTHREVVYADYVEQDGGTPFAHLPGKCSVVSKRLD